VGIKPEEYDFVISLKEQGLIPDYITIDIAHGHSDRVIDMIKHIKKHIPETFLIAGNVGTPEAVRELEHAGADATKVGIGPGKVCITKINFTRTDADFSCICSCMLQFSDCLRCPNITCN